jgi:hypothetical protein
VGTPSAFHHLHHLMLPNDMDKGALSVLKIRINDRLQRECLKITGRGLSPSALDNNSNERRKWKLEIFPREFTFWKSRRTPKVAQVEGSRAVAGHQQARINCCRCLTRESHSQNWTATL